MLVYLSASSEEDLLVLRTVVTELGVETATPVDDDGILRLNLDAWEQADAAIIVITSPSLADNERILVEVGIALGRKLPILILAESRAPYEISRLARVVEMHGSVSPEALRFHLSLFLKSLSSAVSRVEPDTPGRISNVDIGPFRNGLESIRLTTPVDAARYEEWVADLFRASGAETAIPHDPERRGFDLVVSMPDLNRIPGPLVVEVKITTSRKVLIDAAFTLQSLVLREGAGLGLLLYEDIHFPMQFALQIVPMIVSLGFSELVRRLEEETLADVIIHARDEAVHRL
jgi:hypothetical protein